MPGDYSPRKTVFWDCGHKTQEVERSNAYQRQLDIDYFKKMGIDYQVKMGDCKDCLAARRASA